MRWASGLIASGMVFELFCVYEVTPASFLGFALLGLPLIVLGWAIYLWQVWRVVRERGLP